MFIPKRVIFEEEALSYDLGRLLFERFNQEGVEIKQISGSRVSGIPGKTKPEMHVEGKNTLVVGLRKTLKFESCKPSAHYQLPLVSGCMGMCEYCYLNTQMGSKPYVKIHVNINEILNTAGEYGEKRDPETTIFEGAATSDPIPVESYSGALKAAIEYFGSKDKMLFRFVTKYTDIDSLLNIRHGGRTTIRFSINSNDVIKKYEHRTPSYEERIEAAFKVAESGYRLGFIIAPVFLYENWKTDYLKIIEDVGHRFHGINPEFEVISHRFTKRAKENILSIYPKSILPMEEELRKFKFGQFGYGKYIYKDEELNEMKGFFRDNLEKYFNSVSIKYII